MLIPSDNCKKGGGICISPSSLWIQWLVNGFLPEDSQMIFLSVHISQSTRSMQSTEPWMAVVLLGLVMVMALEMVTLVVGLSRGVSANVVVHHYNHYLREKKQSLIKLGAIPSNPLLTREWWSAAHCILFLGIIVMICTNFRSPWSLFMFPICWI